MRSDAGQATFNSNQHKGFSHEMQFMMSTAHSDLRFPDEYVGERKEVTVKANTVVENS